MELLFEDGVGLDGLKLGLEVFGDVGAGVAATAWVRLVVGYVIDFVAREAPVKGSSWSVT